MTKPHAEDIEQEAPRPLTLAKKILAVMEEANYLQKKGWNDVQKYNYAQEADFIELVKPLLQRHRIIGIPQFTHVDSKDHVKGE